MWRNFSLNNDVIVVNACATNDWYRRVSSSQSVSRSLAAQACTCADVCVCFGVSMCANLLLNEFSLSIPLKWHSHTKEKANASGFFPSRKDRYIDTPIPYGSAATATTTTRRPTTMFVFDATNKNNNKRQVARSFQTCASRNNNTPSNLYTIAVVVCVFVCLFLSLSLYIYINVRVYM